MELLFSYPTLRDYIFCSSITTYLNNVSVSINSNIPGMNIVVDEKYSISIGIDSKYFDGRFIYGSKNPEGPSSQINWKNIIKNRTDFIASIQEQWDEIQKSKIDFSSEKCILNNYNATLYAAIGNKKATINIQDQRYIDSGMKAAAKTIGEIFSF